ncbi:DUF4271 domain-containing protein [Aquimarina sp. 2201CG1-2-11]|uniref:DUF4271 domain-containing protein n=1 Tax=Aquimarina discodermiae TaxID=3231043 RepID=UPI00346181F2
MEILTREIVSTNWLTIVIVTCLVLLAVAREVNTLRFSDFMMLLTNSKYIIAYHKFNKLSSLFNVILIIFQVISVSLFIYLCFEVFQWQEIDRIILYFKILTIYTVIVVCKLLIEKIIAAVFSIDSIIDTYLFYKVSYRNFIGVLLLPINIIYIYSTQLSEIMCIIIVVLLVILNGIMLFSYYRKNENVILNNLFYFILYLCALEIAPYFILYKLI